MRQFISALLWAAVLCFCLWPVHRRLLIRVGNRRTLAALLTTLAVALFLVLPFVTIAVTLSGDVGDLARATQKWIDSGPPDAPSWLERIPLVGDRAKSMWQEFADDRAKLGQMAKKLIQPASAWLLGAGLAIGRGVVEVGLSVFLAFFLFRDGAALTSRLTAGLGRVAGERGRHLLVVAGSTVRGVVYGILGTAIVQGGMAGIGFVIAGVPGAALLGLLTFFLSVVPAGPTLVWLPVTIWLFQQGSTGWAIFMLVRPDCSLSLDRDRRQRISIGCDSKLAYRRIFRYRRNEIIRRKGGCQSNFILKKEPIWLANDHMLCIFISLMSRQEGEKKIFCNDRRCFPQKKGSTCRSPTN